MALETIKHLHEIGGFKIIREKPSYMSWDDFDKLRVEFPINITEHMNTISFKIQNGPIKEVGVNGCQVQTIIEVAKEILAGLNEKFYSDFNQRALFNLDAAILALKERTKEREMRNVEGTSQV